MYRIDSHISVVIGTIASVRYVDEFVDDTYHREIEWSALWSLCINQYILFPKKVIQVWRMAVRKHSTGAASRMQVEWSM